MLSDSPVGTDGKGGQLTPVDDGRFYIDTEDSARGSDGAFYAAYRDADGERRYGWFCSNCGSTETAMDPMGHIVCSECGNRRKPTEWDAAYL